MKRRHALGAPPGRFASEAQKRAALERAGWQCVYCHVPLEYADAVIDHRIPWPQGPTEDWNLVASCRRDNKAKGRMSETEFRALLEGHFNDGV